jgi:dienelactone hydrolase
MRIDYAHTEFIHDGVSKPVYVRGDGPAVIVIHEIPGITPHVVRVADWVVAAGFRVYMPLLVGAAGPGPRVGYLVRSLAKVCISREFPVLASHRSSPVTDWLRALARHVHAKSGGKGVGAIGMCFSGNFALSMMMEPALMAPVLSQPSLPFPFGAERKAALHVSPEELTCLKERCAKGDKVLGLRFKGDATSPHERFETLRRELGDAFEGIEIDDKYANPKSPEPRPHSVLTEDLIDEDGQPTKEAAKRVIAFFEERLKSV